MDANRWQLIQDIYLRALDQPVAQRAAALQEACGGDAQLREEVQSLLDAHAEAGNFLSGQELQHLIADLDPEPPEKSLPETLGPYQLLSLLGTGGMGSVYRARDTRLQRDVALKILHPSLAGDPAYVKRFRLEAKAASALNHPNIVTIYDTGQENGTLFIAAELIDGLTLRQRLATGPIPLPESIGIILQCTQALETAHRAGIVHRDLKPENLMIRTDGVVKVVDFGLARLAPHDSTHSQALTLSGGIMGTPRYMSPEQARGHKPDAASDVFSLAAVLYEMVAGTPAFPGTTAEVFAALLAGDPKPTGTILDPVLLRALRTNREQRIPSMAGFTAALTAIDPNSSPSLLARLRAAQWTRRFAHPMGLAAVVSVIILSAYLAISSFARRAPLPDTNPHIIPLTTFSGTKDQPALSPDGSLLAFSWRPANEASRHIYIKPTIGGEPRQLTTSPGNDFTPSWSPDGRSIAFCRRSVQNARDARDRVPSDIYIVPATGGPERKIAQGWLGVSWSPDGKTLAVARAPQDTADSGGIDLLSLESGLRRRLTFSSEDTLPAFSPDGRSIAFIRIFPGRAQEIFVVPTAGGTARQLTFDGQTANGITWTADSRELVFSSPRNRAMGELWRISATGGSPRTLSAALRHASHPSASLRSPRLAFTESWTDTNIYILSGNPSGTLTPAATSTLGDHSPTFAPNGDRFAFVSTRSGSEQIWAARRDGSDPVQLTNFRTESVGSPQWSPDGSRIAFDVWASDESNVFVIDATGGTPRRLSPERGESWMPAWSHDGSWIYFTSRRSGSREIWKMPATGGPATQVTNAGAYEAKPAPDGKTIYFSKSTDTGCCSIWSKPAGGGPERPVPELEPFAPISRSWAVHNQGIYFIAREKGKLPVVRFLDFSTRRVTDYLRISRDLEWTFPSLAVSSDARHLLAAQIDREVDDIMMIEGFR